MVVQEAGVCGFIIVRSEAEIIAASEAAKEATYLRRFLDELGYGDESPTDLMMDNTAGRDLCYNPQHHIRTKHVDRRQFYIREKVKDFTLADSQSPTVRADSR